MINIRGNARQVEKSIRVSNFIKIVFKMCYSVYKPLPI